ncbi:DtxR family transcriptional regulator OS=Streptomyces paromomycinus OX=92743 GN=GKJPGBOP_03320 PE=3 SV=1 [Streptomyces rimosus subsp. rimosus]
MSGLIDTTEMYSAPSLSWKRKVRSPCAPGSRSGSHRAARRSATPWRAWSAHWPATVAGDRHPELTEEGRRRLPASCASTASPSACWSTSSAWSGGQAHAEACRWEHVISQAVERRVVELLRHPTESPYDNPIPGLEELGEKAEAYPFLDAGMVSLMDLEAGRGRQDGRGANRISCPSRRTPSRYTLRRAGRSRARWSV